MFVIAGVNGRVGSAAAAALIDSGKQVLGIVRSAGQADALKRRGAELAVGSLEDARFMASVLNGAEGAFLLSPPNYAEDDFRGYQQRIAAALAEAVGRSRVPHVAVLSSLGADFASGNGPIRGVHELETALRATGATVSALRPGFFQENALSVVPLALAQGIYPSFMPRKAAVPMIATRDIGAAAAAALFNPPRRSEVVDLAGPPYTADDVAATLARLLEREVQAIEIPPEQHVSALIEAGFSPQIAEVYAEMYAFFRGGEVRPVGERKVEGKTTLEETLRSAIAKR